MDSDMMVRTEAFVIDEETEPVVQALEAASARLAVVSDDGPAVVLGREGSKLLHIVLSLLYVPLDQAADLLVAAPPAVQKLVRSGALAAMEQSGQTYVSLQSVLDYRRDQVVRRREALDHMFRVTAEGGLYDAESEIS